MKKKAVKKTINKGKRIFDKEPMCEICRKEAADSFSNYGRAEDSDWKFVGKCQNNAMAYHVTFERFFSSPPSIVDWLVHLYKKEGNWVNFMDMMTPFPRGDGQSRDIKMFFTPNLDGGRAFGPALPSGLPQNPFKNPPNRLSRNGTSLRAVAGRRGLKGEFGE